MNMKINAILMNLEKEKEQSESLRIMRKSQPLIRQFMNVKFRELCEILSDSIKNNYNKCDTTFIKRKHILDDNGVKYAILVLNDYCCSVLKKTCNYYLKINDDCHPNIDPTKIKIHECVENIKKTYNIFTR